jgi:hypothetical protein
LDGGGVQVGGDGLQKNEAIDSNEGKVIFVSCLPDGKVTRRIPAPDLSVSADTLADPPVAQNERILRRGA